MEYYTNLYLPRDPPKPFEEVLDEKELSDGKLVLTMKVGDEYEFPNMRIYELEFVAKDKSHGMLFGGGNSALYAEPFYRLVMGLVDDFESFMKLDSQVQKYGTNIESLITRINPEITKHFKK